MPPRKRIAESLETSIAEPHLTTEQSDAWCDGVALFDRGEYWEAHERWEDLWREMGDDTADDAEIVIRGFIQLTAAMHLVGVGRLDGARSNFAKAASKLALAPPRFLGIATDRLHPEIRAAVEALPALRAIRLR